MASKTPVPNTTTAIILPTTEELKKLPKFSEAISTLTALNDELSQIEQQSKDLKITDATSYKVAGDLTARRKEVVKLAEKAVEPYKSPLRKWLDFVQTHFNIVKNHAEQMNGILAPKMEAYDREEIRKAQAEAARIQREKNAQIAREAEEKKQADLAAAAELRKTKVAQINLDFENGIFGKRERAKRLKEAGAEEESLAALAEAEAEELRNKPPVTVTVEPNVPTMKGVMRRTNYRAECINREGFLLEWARRLTTGDHSMDNFVLISDERLSAAARDMKDSDKFMKTFPHTRAWDEKTY